VRWVDNKEKHADEIQEIVTQYFMTQRIKPADPSDKEAQAAYVEKLTLLHGMLIQSMKAKQGTDLDVVQKLRTLLDSFSEAYLGHKVQ
jgi:nickel superoxide dismutase